LPGKIDIVRQFAWKNQKFSSICLEKSKFLGNLPIKIEIFLPGSMTPDFKPD